MPEDQSVKSLLKQMEWEKMKGSLRAMLPTFHLQGEKLRIFEHEVKKFTESIENHPQDILDYKEVWEGKYTTKLLENNNGN